ncbi:hypothetical protein V7654_09420 [Bacillus sp. JJ1609]
MNKKDKKNRHKKRSENHSIHFLHTNAHEQPQRTIAAMFTKTAKKKKP